MENQLYQSSNSNPTITWRTPNGQTQSGTLDQAPPQVQLLYQKLPQASAQTSTAQSQATTAGVGAQAATYPLKLKNDLANGMTLSKALTTYSSLMKPDDIFTQYLAQNPSKLPPLSPTELRNMGVSDQILGQNGQNGSFADRWNTRNAILGLRDLQNKFHTTHFYSSLLNTLGLGGNNAAAYNSAYNLFTEHLNSLIPGGSNASGEIQKVSQSIPSVNDPREYNRGKADAQFNSAEDQILKAKGYDYTDIGLNPSTPPETKQTGGNILNFLLGSAMNSAQDIGTGIRAKMEQPQIDTMLQKAQNLETQAQNTTDPNLKSYLYKEANQYRSPVGKEEGNISKSFSSDVNQNPLIRGVLGGIEIGSTAELPAAVESAAKMGVKGAQQLLDFFNPTRSISKAGAARDFVVNAATDAGKTINGNSILDDINSWAKTAKRGNLGQGDAINKAVADAKEVFKGQKITPEEAANIYREADSGYTKTGIAKTPIQANIDRGLRDILGEHLDDVAPGWKKATADMAKGYKDIKSPLRQGVKNLAKYGLPFAGGAATSDILGHFLFGGK